MRKDILKDKFIGPLLFSLFVALMTIRSGDWLFSILFFLGTFLVSSFALNLEIFLYIQDYSINNESVSFQFQKSFLKNKTETISILLESVESVDFRSKSFLEQFHMISIKYVDPNGLFAKHTFKTKNDEAFIKLLYRLKK